MAIARTLTKGAVQSPTGRLRRAELRLAGSTRPAMKTARADNRQGVCGP